MLGVGDPRYSAETQRSHMKKLANEEEAADPRYQHREEQTYPRQEQGVCNESPVRLQLIKISS